MSRSLPVLKLFLIPPAAYFLYTAYCYYSEQNRKAKQASDAPTKLMNILDQRIRDCATPNQLRKTYEIMNKHVERCIVSPSLKQMRVTNSSVDQLENNSIWSSGYRTKLDIDINHFNYQNEKREGTFTAGFWTNFVTTKIFNIRQTSEFESIIADGIGLRQTKCMDIAHHYESSQQRGFTEVYQECIRKTNEPVAALSRQLDFIQKFREAQLSA